MIKRVAAILGLGLGLHSALGAMAPRPASVPARLRTAASAWRAADMTACAQILQPLAWADPAAAREWAAFLFLQERYGDVEAFFASTPAAQLKDDEARLWLARSQLDLAHYALASETLASLSRSAKPLPLLLAAEAASGVGAQWPAVWPAALAATLGTRWDADCAISAAEEAGTAGQLAEAEALYKRAEGADQSYSMVHARLAALYAAQGRTKDQRIRLERALRVDPDDQALQHELNRLLRAHPAMQQALDREKKRALERFALRPNPTVAAAVPVSGEPLVRVGLLVEATRFRLKLGGATVVEGAGRTLPAESVWQMRPAPGGGWRLRPLSHPGEAPVDFNGPLRLRPEDAASTIGLYDVPAGAGYFWAGKEDRYYRGLLELRPKGRSGVTVVDELGLEAYLLSVVPSEAVPSWPEAALEAQAVAARTEAWRSLGRFSAKGYDLCPTVACAVYSGVGVEHPRSTAAVTRTAGLVLEDPRQRLHPTFYMHHSGGYTQEPGEAWTEAAGGVPMAGPDAPPGARVRKLFPLSPAGLLHYLDDLDGDVDVWARNSGSFRWTLRFSAAEADQWVGRRHAITPLQAVVPLERSAGGYVRRALFVGDGGSSVGSSDYLRSALRGMRSNLFYPELRLDEHGRLKALLLHGGGWGHGVGLAQVGAKAQADAGRDAPQILRSYFPAARLKRRYQGFKPAPE